MKVRYFLKIGDLPEQEVTQEAFSKTERTCGFFPKRGCGPVATGGFSKGNISGFIKYEEKPL